MLLATKTYWKEKKKGKEKGITESDGQTKHEGYHLLYDGPTCCRIRDYCLWFLGSLGVSGIRSWGSHLPVVAVEILCLLPWQHWLELPSLDGESAAAAVARVTDAAGDCEGGGS